MSAAGEGPGGGLSSALRGRTERGYGTQPWAAPGGDAAQHGFKTGRAGPTEELGLVRG